MLARCIVAAALVLTATARMQAMGDPPAARQIVAPAQAHDGRVINITNDLLVMAKDGKEMRFMLSKETKIVIDRMIASPDALKPGVQVRVSTPRDRPDQAAMIEVVPPR